MDKQSRRGKHNRSKVLKDKNKKHAKNKTKKSGCEQESSEEEVDNSQKVREIPIDTVGKSSSANSSKSDEKNETQSQTRTEFSKRKVTSNWQKYDEPHVELHGDMLRGADFDQILNTSSGGSFFRFKDELIMDRELNSFNKAEEFFSVDVDDLNKALLCVPLQIRLMIDPKAFPKKVLAKMEASAYHNSLSYAPPERMDGIKANAQRETTEEINKGIVNILRGENKNGIPGNEFKIEMDSKTELAKIQSAAQEADKLVVDLFDSEELSRKDIDRNCHVNAKSDSSAIEDLVDLNFLLNLGKVDLAPVTHSETSLVTKSVTNDKQIEAMGMQSNQPSADTDETHLEDWLDAVLGAD